MQNVDGLFVVVFVCDTKLLKISHITVNSTKNDFLGMYGSVVYYWEKILIQIIVSVTK